MKNWDFSTWALIFVWLILPFVIVAGLMGCKYVGVSKAVEYSWTFLCFMPFIIITFTTVVAGSVAYAFFHDCG